MVTDRTNPYNKPGLRRKEGKTGKTINNDGIGTHQVINNNFKIKPGSNILNTAGNIHGRRNPRDGKLIPSNGSGQRFSCADIGEPSYIESCQGLDHPLGGHWCVPQSWMVDNICDDGTDPEWGYSDLRCYNNDAGLCGSVSDQPYPCPGAEGSAIEACQGTYCWLTNCNPMDEMLTCAPDIWLGDGYQDCNDQAYGADLTCYGCDGGDCPTEQCGTPYEDNNCAAVISGLNAFLSNYNLAEIGCSNWSNCQSSIKNIITCKLIENSAYDTNCSPNSMCINWQEHLINNCTSLPKFSFNGEDGNAFVTDCDSWPWDYTDCCVVFHEDSTTPDIVALIPSVSAGNPVTLEMWSDEQSWYNKTHHIKLSLYDIHFLAGLTIPYLDGGSPVSFIPVIGNYCTDGSIPGTCTNDNKSAFIIEYTFKPICNTESGEITDVQINHVYSDWERICDLLPLGACCGLDGVCCDSSVIGGNPTEQSCAQYICDHIQGGPWEDCSDFYNPSLYPYDCTSGYGDDICFGVGIGDEYHNIASMFLYAAVKNMLNDLFQDVTLDLPSSNGWMKKLMNAIGQDYCEAGVGNECNMHCPMPDDPDRGCLSLYCNEASGMCRPWYEFESPPQFPPASDCDQWDGDGGGGGGGCAGITDSIALFECLH